MQTSNNTISITSIKAFGHHGVLLNEKQTGQYFLIDLQMTLDFTDSITSDNLADTIDYIEVVRDVRKLVESERWYLIERLADEIANLIIKNFPRTEKISVRVHKPYASTLLDVSDLSVEVKKSRV